MIKIFKKVSLILTITVVTLEIFGAILGFLNIIPNGSPAIISIFADKKVSLWHPKNITFCQFNRVYNLFQSMAKKKLLHNI